MAPTWTAGDEHWPDLIREDRIDILVDLAGHTRGQSPADVRAQAGAGADHLGRLSRHHGHAANGLSDLGPLADSCRERTVVYRRRVVRMPDGYVCYEPPD